MSSIMRRRNRLMAWSVMNEVVETPQSQDRAPRPAIAFPVPPASTVLFRTGFGRGLEKLTEL